MSLAVLILAHKNARQVERLFRAVHREGDVIVLHFDRRADASLHRLGDHLVRSHANVMMLKPRTILWGGYRMAAVQLEAMDAALRTGAKWRHFINLTGQDFPIKPIDQLEGRLDADGDASYVSWFDPLVQPYWKNARERLERFHVEWPWLERCLQVPGVGRRIRAALGWKNDLPHVPGYKRSWPHFRYFGGANHVILSRAACEWLTHDPGARRMLQWLRHAAHANEIVFQTALLNSPLAPSLINTHLREIDFPDNVPHPKTFRIGDFDRLASSPMYFARKFDDTVDAAILDRLERHLGLPEANRYSPAHS